MMTVAGNTTNAPIKQVEIEIATSRPKNRTGENSERPNTAKPTSTESALNTIPLPVVIKVLWTAMDGSE